MFSSKPIKAVLVYNQPSCDHKISEMPMDVIFPLNGVKSYTDKGQIKGDIDSSWLTFKLSVGQNKLYVRYFYDCSPSDFIGNTHTITGKTNCKISNDFQTVLYPISVNYSEFVLKGEKIERPSKCP